MIDKSNWSPANLNWLAGLLEGEACFSIDRNTLVIRCEMTDEDVIKRLHQLAGFGNITLRTWANDHRGHQLTWLWKSRNSKDVYDFELAILPFMGIRRTEKILNTHKLRREYEADSTRNNIRRIFPRDSD